MRKMSIPILLQYNFFLNAIRLKKCVIKLLEKLDNALHANVDTLFYNKDIEKVTFITNQIHILTVDLVKINRDNDSNFDESDPDTIIHVRLLA